jgi:cell division protein FtsI (penicillin-binding protein 3)
MGLFRFRKIARQESEGCRPCLPHRLDPRSTREHLLRLDGTTKQALEVGRTRLLVAGTVFALAFLAVGLRVVDLAVLQAGNEPRLTSTPHGDRLETTRADILDRNGVLLATSLPVASLYANPRQVSEPVEAAARLATVLADVEQASIASRLASDRGFVWIKRNLTPREQYLVNRLGIPGLYFQREERRVYPQGPLAAHIVGFADIDNRGLAGIEQSFNEVLRGGGPLQLSLDIRIQHILTEELNAAMTEFKGIGAAGVVMDVQSGEILALASLPTFDPNDVGKASDDARFNRATLGIYEMGSVFKIFTSAMALDRGIVTLHDGYDVTNPIRVARFTIRDFKPKHGWLSVPEIFMYSSNIGTVHMAMDAGTEAQQDFLQDLGLLRPANIELPEVGAPMVPSPWREINTMTIAYGHGVAVSPLQTAAAVSAVVNGGVRLAPTLLRRPAGQAPLGQRVISEEVSRQMRWMMRLVVQNGTGRFAEAKGYLVGGKTGTSDKQRGRGYDRNARIASFVGAFPMNDPRYVVLAMVDEPKGLKRTYGYATGGWVAAPVVGHVVERMAPLVGIEPVESDIAAPGSKLLVEAKADGTHVATR